MRVIQKTEPVDVRSQLLQERDRLSVELDVKRGERFDLERQRRQIIDADEDSVIGSQLEKILGEIEALQIRFLHIYQQTSCVVGDEYFLDYVAVGRIGRHIKQAHIPMLPKHGNIVLKALRGLLVEGESIEAGESFSVENETAHKLLQGCKVIVDERYLVGE